MHKNVAELKRLRDSNPLDNSIGSSTAIQKNTLKYFKKNSRVASTQNDHT